MRWLTAIPVFNEAASVRQVLQQVRRFTSEILVVNDGSTDATPQLLDKEADLHRINHPRNRGYGAAVLSAFRFARDHHYDVLVTVDCDGQHEPARIPVLLEACTEQVDIVSGSRYLRDFRQDDAAPNDRRHINQVITNYINQHYGLNITDAFCGFKAYRRTALERLQVSETGWGMPLQVWAQAARLGLQIAEVAVPRLYLDPNRAFGGILNDPRQRLAHYLRILHHAEVEPLAGAVLELRTQPGFRDPSVWETSSVATSSLRVDPLCGNAKPGRCIA